MQERTREEQFQDQVEFRDSHEFTSLGIKTSHTWHKDPKRLLFSLARYKFAAKMLSGKERVLEIGCGDAVCTRIVLQEVGSVVAVDADPIFVEDAVSRAEKEWPLDVRTHDILTGPVAGHFHAAYSLDVIEHIPREQTHAFMQNICRSLAKDGVLIVGTPSLNSQAYASEMSRRGHINCMNAPELRTVMSRYFENVFMFSMNDEVVHTGFHSLAHYLLGLGVGVKSGFAASSSSGD